MNSSSQKTDEKLELYLYPRLQHGNLLNQWSGVSQELDALQVHAVPTDAGPELKQVQYPSIAVQTSTKMGDKVQSMSAMDMGHGKLSDGNGAQTSTSYNSNYGYKKQQQKSKGSSYSKGEFNIRISVLQYTFTCKISYFILYSGTLRITDMLGQAVLSFVEWLSSCGTFSTVGRSILL